MSNRLGILASLALLLGAGYPAQAGHVINFQGVTGHINDPGNVQTAANQITAEVFDLGTNSSGITTVEFLFKNVGPNASSLATIGFEDGTLLAQGTAEGGTIASDGSLILAPSAVKFEEQNNYPNFGFPFDTSALFSIGADNPQPFDGLNPGEWLSVEYTLQSGKDFNDLLTALNDGLNGPDPDPNDPGRYTSLRLAIHVIAFQNGGSEKLVNGGPTPVPAPPSVILAGIGMLGFGGWARLRRKFAKTA